MPSLKPSAVRLAALEAACFVLVAALALGFQAWLPTALPTDANERAVAEVLAREGRPGDVVLLHPWWTERARLFLPEGLPVTGYLGDETDPLVESPRIWVLSQPALPYTKEAEFQASFFPGRTPLGPQRRFGSLVLGLYHNGRAQPVRFSALEAMGTATAAVDVPGVGRTECAREGAGFRCPAGARVESGWHEVLYRPTRCLLVVPPGGPGAVELTFDGVPVAARVRLEAGIIWEHAWKHERTPLHAEVSDADSGAPLASIVIPAGKEGFVSAEAPGGARRLRLRVQSDNAHEREACLVLRALDAPLGAP